MFRLMRFYSVASFIIIFLTAAVLTLFYRQVTMHWIDHLAKTGNLTLAETVFSSIKPELVAYLGAKSDGDASDRGITWQELPTGLVTGMLRLTRETSVGSIKIYNRDGQVFFSTEKGETGTSVGNHPGFQSALDGQIFSFMTYRDTFNSFEGMTAEDNLMHTYIPIRNGPADPILGVLEIHTDMNHLVEENNKVLLITLFGAEFILALLYAVLIIVVRHAKNIIESQQKTIQERTTSLEILSKRLLKVEEQKKQKIAFNLHEGLAQTLSAIKFNVESGSKQIAADDANSKPLESIVPVLQSAIQEVRSIATELRPSSLDELGLLPTIKWFCREFEQQYSEIDIKQEISLNEAAIPIPLKIVIYRIIESTLKSIAHYSNTDQIKLAMQRAGDKIHLRICHAPVDQSSATAVAQFDPGTSSWPRFSDSKFHHFAEMRERASLSGGTFTATQDKAGWVTLHASWAC